MSELKYKVYNDLEELSKSIRQRRKELNSELSRIDKEISDIRHYIEFYPLSASKGYKMAKMLKDCLVDRREIKNEQEVLNRICMMNVGHIGNGKGRDDLDKLLDKHYTPRVLSDLFEEK